MVRVSGNRETTYYNLCAQITMILGRKDMVITMTTINSEKTMMMNGMPIGIFVQMQNHLLPLAEKAFNRSAGCQTEWQDEWGSTFVGKMFLDLSYDEKDLGRTYVIEVTKNNDKYHNSKITCYGGAKRPKNYFGEPPKSCNMIARYSK